MEVLGNQPAIRKSQLWTRSKLGISRSPTYIKYRRNLIKELPNSVDYNPDLPILAEIKVWDTEVYSISEYLKAPIDVVSLSLHKTKCDKNVRQIKITRIASNDKNFSISMNNID